MPFFLDGNPTPTEIAEAINYLLANVTAGVPANAYAVSNNTVTGFVSNTIGQILQYQYRYLDVKYADDAGGTNLSDNPQGKDYFGLRNTDEITESTNPADYTWFKVTGGFGLNKVLWLTVTGGRHAAFAVSESVPDTNQNWMVVPTQAIDLDNPFARYEQYMVVRFADNSVGSNISTSPTNKKFWGVYTSADGTVPTDPTVFEWSPFDFGTTYKLFYRSFGGRNIAFQQQTFEPLGYIPVTDVAINLDVSTIGSVSSIGIVSQTPLIVQGPYRYLLVRYADDITGTGISTNPTGKTFFGLQASDVLTFDSNPADYQWFAAGGTFLTDLNLWSKTTANNIVQFSLTFDAPDASSWVNVTSNTSSLDPNIDVYARTGTLVTNISSPTSGRIGYSSIGPNGVVNLNLNPYGQGATTGGFSIDPLTTASIQVDEFGRVLQAGALDEVRFSSMLTHATAGQTVFTFSNAQPNQILVFKNGSFLTPGSDFTRNSTSFTLAAPCALNDVIAAYYIRLIDGSTSADKVPFTISSQTLSNGQINIYNTDPAGSELLFINGALIVDLDYSYLDGGAGYQLGTASTGGLCVVVSFAYNNANSLIFGENYATTAYGTTNVVYPTQFYRNSSLIWLNGALLRPTDDYTVSGAGTLSYNYTSVGFLNISNQPTQFCTFNSVGEASASSLGSAGVLGYDIPVEIERPMTIADMFKQMQARIDLLEAKIGRIEE